jgi:hypothetical protein
MIAEKGPFKSAVETAPAADIREFESDPDLRELAARYMRLVPVADEPGTTQLYLRVNHQSFPLGIPFEGPTETNWYAWQCLKALRQLAAESPTLLRAGDQHETASSD